MFTIKDLPNAFSPEVAEKILNNMGTLNVLHWIKNPDYYNTSYDLVCSSFIWEDSPEGVEYWAAISDEQYKKDEQYEDIV